MIKRLTSGWTIARILYISLGVLILFQSVAEEQWWGLALGIYIAAMGLFGFGCAGGNCAVQYKNSEK